MSILRFVSFASLLFILVACSGETIPTFERIQREFSLSDWGDVGIAMDSQGMDIYEDTYLFQASYIPGSSCAMVTVNLKEKRILGGFQFNELFPLIHMNNVNCGEKWSPNDNFPLLYISEAHNEKRCFVIRLLDNASQYSVVQTIKYNGEKYASNNYMDWFLDNDGGFLYAYGHLSAITPEYCFVKFSLPPLTQESVVFTDDDIIDDFLINSDILVPQGTKMRNGTLHTVYGFNTDEYPSWHVRYDIVNKKIVSKVKLDKRLGEPEAVSFFQDKTIISNNATNPSYWIINE